MGRLWWRRGLLIDLLLLLLELLELLLLLELVMVVELLLLLELLLLELLLLELLLLLLLDLPRIPAIVFSRQYRPASTVDSEPVVNVRPALGNCRRRAPIVWIDGLDGAGDTTEQGRRDLSAAISMQRRDQRLTVH